MMSLFDYTEDSWTHETTIGGGFTGFMFADNDGQMSAKTSVNLFCHFTIYDLTTNGKKHGQFDILTMFALMKNKNWHLGKIQNLYFALVYMKPGKGVTFLFVYNRMVSQITYLNPYVVFV